MKNFVLFVSFLVLSIINYSSAGGMDDIPPEIKEMLKQLHDTCVEESGTTEDLITTANTGNFPEDKSLKCYLKCLMASIGIMTDDGAVDWETYEGMLPDFMQEYGSKVVARCKNIPMTSDHCENAFQMNKCSYEADPTMFMIW